MSQMLDLYLPGESWLHRLDPRVKLWATGLGLATALLLRDLPVLVSWLVGLHLLLKSGGLSWRRLGTIWRQVALLALLILVLQPWFAPGGQVLLALGPLRLTTGGLLSGAVLALRALCMALTIAVLLFTTEQRALVLALVRLGLPYTWGLTLSLTLRFLPALFSLFTAVREAQAARGWVAEGNLWQRARDYIPVVVAVIIGTLRLSDQLTLALAARGLEGSTRRTVWRDLRMRPADWITLVGVTALFIGTLLMVYR